MLLKNQINYKKSVEFFYKIFIGLTFFLILPGFFKFLDGHFQRCFGLSRYINVFDFIFFNFFAFCIIKKNNIKNYLSVPLLLLILYLFLARISIVFSMGEIHHRSYYDLFESFLVFGLFCVFFTPFFQENYKNIIKVFLTLFFTIALFESIIGIMQFVLQKPLGFSLLKEPSFGLDINSSAKVFISDNHQFFLNKIMNLQNNYLLRAHGTFIHPNIFSGFLNISGIFTLYLIYKSKKKIIFNIFLLLQLTALILTFSRAAVASFVICSSLFFLLMIIKKYEVKKMLFLFIFCFFIVGAVFSKYIIERGLIGKFLQSKKANELCVSSDNTRLGLKKAAVNMIKKHPFFGIGFRNFLIKENEYSNIKLQRAYVHNIYLLIASEMGVLALIIFVSMITLILLQVIRRLLDPLNICVLCVIVSFLLIGFFDHYPISSYFGKITLFTLLGFLNFSITINKHSSCSQKAFLCQ